MSRYHVRGYSEVGGEDTSDLPGQLREQRDRVRVRLAGVGRVVAVMSGKGGVGKSLVAASLAGAVAAEGGSAGLLDADLDGPSAPRILGAPPTPPVIAEDGVRPVETRSGVRLMSTGVLLREDAPLRWRGPEGKEWVWRGARERGVLREFLSDVAWEDLDVLVVDLPPGNARLEQLVGLVPDLHGAVAVTLPSGASASAVRRSLGMCRDREIPVSGVVENMSEYACPGCRRRGPLFPGRAGPELAEEFGIPLLARVPFDPEAAARADHGEIGRLLAETEAGRALRGVRSVVPKGGDG